MFRTYLIFSLISIRPVFELMNLGPEVGDTIIMLRVMLDERVNLGLPGFAPSFLMNEFIFKFRIIRSLCKSRYTRSCRS